MEFFLIVMVVIHVFCGVFWAGGALMVAGFLMPSVREAGEIGTKFMQVMMQKSKITMYMNISAAATLITGGWLYWRASGGFQGEWILTSSGLALTIGSSAAALAWFLATFLFQRPAALRIEAIGTEIAASGGPPSPEQGQELQALGARIAKGGIVTAWLLGISVVGMAIYQYI